MVGHSSMVTSGGSGSRLRTEGRWLEAWSLPYCVASLAKKL